MTSGEPPQLARGKAFHREVQADWLANARDGEVFIEHGCIKPSGRRGRMDVFVSVDGSDDLTVVVEVKGTDWGRMTDRAVRRNARRQLRQIWHYIDSELAQGRDVCPGVVFPTRPKCEGRAALVEMLFEEEGIPVVWADEPVEPRR